ncbi:GNAT family N-acetyltransferase [Streptomyces sp. NPDC047002]|uniref:GNAT family N-acetyltransferase n=1 Tax=Streptomyces sp. NPDC047002 TaxID=3155475 RepID=UPI003457038A
MEVRAVRALFDRRMRREAEPDGGARVDRTARAARQTGGPDDWNGVLWSDLDEASADAEIAAQKAHFAGLGLPFEWKLYAHDGPQDLGTRLAAAGFVPEPAESLMVAATAEVVARTADAAPPDGVRIERVADAAGVALMADVHTRVFGRPSSFPAALERQLAEAPETVWAAVALAGATPVCAARAELPPGKEFASLWGGGTLPPWRGRGVYRALVARRARVAGRRGYRYLQVDASDRSRPILERLGFARLTTTTPYVYDPDA